MQKKNTPITVTASPSVANKKKTILPDSTAMAIEIIIIGRPILCIPKWIFAEV